MRPPDLPGGNFPRRRVTCREWKRFNEAAGFTRRKPAGNTRPSRWNWPSFNEAAGFTRRKPGRGRGLATLDLVASMRPPDLPGGNQRVIRL